MTNSNLKPANRVKNIPPYAFAAMAQKVRELSANGADIIRLDMGNPDMPPAPHIIQSLIDYSQHDNTHGYAGYIGIPALRQAIATYYQNRFGVSLDVNTELSPLIGSKEGLANLHLAWLDPGDLALIPDPGYIVYEMGPRLVNATVQHIPLTPQNNWLPDFESISPETAHKARLMWLNYPNNPTGAVADLAFFEKAVAFCRQYNILLCHDNPYSDVTFEDYQGISPLQINGAKDVVLEFNSLSKTYNMAGWRVGMAVGNAQAIKALSTIKTQIDSGFALPIQHMATTALTSDQSWLVDRNKIYQQRRDMVISALQHLGLNVPAPKATLYIWFPTPNGYSDTDFYELILQKANVSIAPGSIYGQQGKNWMRLSIGVTTNRLAEALERLKKV
jgi:LL-diaminopimelate aminotransferase